MSYSYDADGQVTSADTPNSPNAIPVPVTRSYDSLGNLTMLGDTAQAFSADGSLCWSATVSVAGSGRDCASAPSGATSFLYNANGQRTSAGSKGYAWNAAGELATAGSSSMTLRCDPEGLRVGMITGTGWRRCSWDDTSGVGELMSGDCAGGEMFFFVYGPDGMPCEQLDFNGGATTEVWLHQDATGSVGLSTDSAGNQTWTRSYDPWGNVTATTGKPPQLGCDSEPVDPTGQIYLQARYYDPTTGQFLSSDPAFTATLSSYGYTDNDPLNGSDPTGLCWHSWLWACPNAVMKCLRKEQSKLEANEDTLFQRQAQILDEATGTFRSLSNVDLWGQESRWLQCAEARG